MSAPPTPRPDLAAGLQLFLRGFARRHPLELAQRRHQELFGAAPVPVMVLGSTGAVHVLDDRVLGADLDLAVAAGTAVELAGDAADQPRLVALVGQSAQAPADAG